MVSNRHFGNWRMNSTVCMWLRMRLRQNEKHLKRVVKQIQTHNKTIKGRKSNIGINRITTFFINKFFYIKKHLLINYNARFITLVFSLNFYQKNYLNYEIFFWLDCAGLTLLSVKINSFIRCLQWKIGNFNVVNILIDCR